MGRRALLGAQPQTPLQAGREQPGAQGGSSALRTEPSVESTEGFLFRHSRDVGSQNLSCFQFLFLFHFAIRTQMSQAIVDLITPQI